VKDPKPEDLARLAGASTNRVARTLRVLATGTVYARNADLAYHREITARLGLAPHEWVGGLAGLPDSTPSQAP
jgi:hypothetical protein